MMNMENINKYKKHFNLRAFNAKMKRVLRKVGIRGVYTILLLFYTLKQKDTPIWARNVVVGVLGYFISPVDAIPDLTPFIGYTDDFGLLGFGLVAVAAYINSEVRGKARSDVHKFFDDVDDLEFVAVDKTI